MQDCKKKGPINGTPTFFVKKIFMGQIGRPYSHQAAAAILIDHAMR